MDWQDKVELVARMMAEQSYRRERPTATADQARAWAAGHWTHFIRRALEVLAVREAWCEARKASPWN